MRLAEVIGEHVVEGNTELVLRVEPGKSVLSRRQDVDVAQYYVPVLRQALAGEVGVVRCEDERIGRVTDADSVVSDLAHQPSPAGIRLDANTIRRTVDAQVPDQYVAHAPARVTADGHAMAGVEVIIHDGYIGGRRARARADCNIVVAGMDVTMRDGDVRGPLGVYAIGVARGLRRHDLHAPGGKPVGPPDGHMMIGGIAQCNPIEGEVAYPVQLEEPGHLLILIHDFCRIGKLPPRSLLPEDSGSPATIERPITHDATVSDVAAAQESSTARTTALTQHTTTSWSGVV